MSLIDRYLFRETLLNWFAVTLILTLILVSNSLIVVLNRTSEQGLPQDTVIPLVFFNSIGLLVALVPLGLYLGVMLALGRLYQDSEMTAMAACGVGMQRVYRPVLLCATLAVVLMGLLSILVSPWAARSEGAIMRDIALRSELAGLVPGNFNESRAGNTVIYVSGVSADRDRLEQVFVKNEEADGRIGVEMARGAQQYVQEDGDSFLVFEDGRRYVGLPGQADYRIVEFGRHGVRVPAPTDLNQSDDRAAAKSNSELWQSDKLIDRSELQWRWSSPLFALVLALIAVPLSHTEPRKGRYGRLALAILVYIPYSNLLLSAKNWMKFGITPVEIGLWWVHALALLVAIVLLLHRFGWRRLLRLGGSVGTAVRA